MYATGATKGLALIGSTSIESEDHRSRSHLADQWRIGSRQLLATEHHEEEEHPEAGGHQPDPDVGEPSPPSRPPEIERPPPHPHSEPATPTDPIPRGPDTHLQIRRGGSLPAQEPRIKVGGFRWAQSHPSSLQAAARRLVSGGD
ncbi:hypothetical protein BHE74_00015136 [Ensete ventricosum]|nr:hypothetical protein GW17_00000993 [Ensete ventricosum]RWW76748.1 hypothetical protein BHE74_00015136 [Ensete ventricosum]